MLYRMGLISCSSVEQTSLLLVERMLFHELHSWASTAYLRLLQSDVNRSINIEKG